MHELSIAISLIELAEEEAERRGGVRVDAIHLRLGLLAGVAREALLASYELACEGTSLEGSRLVIEDVPIIVYCPKCCITQPVSSIQFSCPQCGTPTSEILQGKELQVAALEIAEPETNELELKL